MSGVIIGILIACSFVVLMIGGTAWAWARLRRKYGFWLTTALSLLLLFGATCIWSVTADQIAVRYGRWPHSDVTETRVTPALDPSPEYRARVVTERRLGPLLLGRTFEEDGVPELGGGRRITESRLKLGQTLGISAVFTALFGIPAVFLGRHLHRRHRAGHGQPAANR